MCLDGRAGPRARADVGDDQIIRFYEQGHTAAEIGDRLGCSTSLVYVRLERRGIARRPGAPRGGVRPADAELAHLYWDCGLSLRDLAGRYGVSRQALRGWLVAAGVERHPAGASAVAGDGEDLAGLYRAGWSAPAIADRLGCSPPTVYRRLDAAGVARRPVTPAVSRQDLIEGLDRGLPAPAIATHLGVSPSCVCRALTREQLVTATPAARQRRRLRHPEYYRSPTPPADNVGRRQRQRSTLKHSPNFSRTLTSPLTGGRKHSSGRVGCSRPAHRPGLERSAQTSDGLAPA